MRKFPSSLLLLVTQPWLASNGALRLVLYRFLIGMDNRKIFTYVCYITLFLLLVVPFWGCISSLKQNYPEKKFYILEPDQTAIKKYPLKFNSIKIINFRISNVYESKGFIYKYKDSSFEIDFYNEFLVPVPGMVTEKTGDWLIQSGVIMHTANRSRLLESDFILEGFIKSIYGDFSNEEKPKAVLEIDFYVLNNDTMGIKSGRLYSQSIDIKEANSESLIVGFNQALTNILLDLTQDISKLNTKSSEVLKEK